MQNQSKATRLRTAGLRYSVSGVHKRTSQACRRRVSGWVMKKLQKGAWPQKLVKQAKAARACFRRFFAAPTPSAALAHQLGKFPQPANDASSPRARKLANHLCKFPERNGSQPTVQAPQQATLAHHAGKHPQPHQTCAAKPRPKFARQFPCRVYWLRRVDPIFCKFLHRHLV